MKTFYAHENSFFLHIFLPQHVFLQLFFFDHPNVHILYISKNAGSEKMGSGLILYVLILFKHSVNISGPQKIKKWLASWQPLYDSRSHFYGFSQPLWPSGLHPGCQDAELSEGLLTKIFNITFNIRLLAEFLKTFLLVANSLKYSALPCEVLKGREELW